MTGLHQRLSDGRKNRCHCEKNDNHSAIDYPAYRMLINTERRQTVHYRADRMAFRVLLCMDGCGTISYDEGTVNFYKGDCVFVPADSEVLTIHGQAQFLDIRG